MATPVGAEHRDLEQRLRDAEARNRELATAVSKLQMIAADHEARLIAGGL